MKISKEQFRIGTNSFTVILIYIVLVFTAAIIDIAYDNYKITDKPSEKTVIKKEEKVESNSEEVQIKSKVLLNIPYTVQAPLTNWNVHEESCEEAAILMINYYLNKIKINGTVIPKEKANQELINMVNWQKTNYGKEDDLNMYRLGRLAKDYFGYNFEVFEDINENGIKKALSNGDPVLVPVMTHGLDNPHYGRESTYHVLLIKGYDSKGIITNDAGVKEGENYRYSWSTLWKAIDQQTPKMNQGRDMLILSKK